LLRDRKLPLELLGKHNHKAEINFRDKKNLWESRLYKYKNKIANILVTLL